MELIPVYRYVHTKPDKFEFNVTFFYLDRPSVHTKTVSKNGTFWKRSPKWIIFLFFIIVRHFFRLVVKWIDVWMKWINLKTLARCVSVDNENGTFWKHWCDNSHIISVVISSKTIMWTENILSIFATNAFFKFIWLSVHGRPINRKICIFKFIRLSVNVS